MRSILAVTSFVTSAMLVMLLPQAPSTECASFAKAKTKLQLVMPEEGDGDEEVVEWVARNSTLGEWSECSQSCGNGLSSRSVRQCDRADSTNCSLKLEVKTCNDKPCPGTLEAIMARTNTCTPEYAREVNHTMCLVDDPRVQRSGVTEKDKHVIIDLHNKFRGGTMPPAINMLTVKWDDKMAAVAEKHAKQCEAKHDENRCIPGYRMQIGQNTAHGVKTWTDAITGWYNEIRHFQYGRNNVFGMVGHYTQLMYSGVVRIGCGYAECTGGYKRHYACNYGASQVYASNIAPYTSGKRCAACPDSCRNGLCDCAGKLCLNGGTLDINTCKCSCPELYSGEECETLNCPDADTKWMCRNHKIGRVESCTHYYNFENDCPYLCGLCKYETPPDVAS